MAEEWDRLAQVTRDRRLALNLTQADVQSAGGPSSAKVREVENRRTTTLSASKRRDLERALQWEPGSVDRVLAGYDPVPQRTDDELETDAMISQLRHPSRSASVDQTTAVWGLLNDIRNGHPPERLREQARKLLDDMAIEQHAAVYQRLVRQDQLRIAKLATELDGIETVLKLADTEADDDPEGAARVTRVLNQRIAMVRTALDDAMDEIRKEERAIEAALNDVDDADDGAEAQRELIESAAFDLENPVRRTGERLRSTRVGKAEDATPADQAPGVDSEDQAATQGDSSMPRRLVSDQNTKQPEARPEVVIETERQSDYGLAGRKAGRSVGRRIRDEHDSAAEAPHNDPGDGTA